MIKDYFLIIFRNFSKRKLRGWLTILGILIGIAAVVALIGLGEGLREAINAQFGVLGTDIISVTASGGFGPPGSGVANPLTNEELEAIKEINGVEGAAGRLLESGKIVFNKKAGFSLVTSVPDGEDRKIIETAINLKAGKGRLLKDGDEGVAMLGIEFMKEDNVFGKPIRPGSKIQIQDKEFKVIGILERIGNLQVDTMIALNEDDFRDLFSIPEDEYDSIAVKFDQNLDVDEIESDIEKELRKIRDVEEGEEDFSVETPQSILKKVNSVILGIQIFVYLIAGISILVGGIGIMNTMYTTVVERTKEIGIMKAIGAKNSTIFSLFFIESGLLGAVGGGIGALFGFLIATGLVFAGRLALGTDLISAHITPQLIVGSILFAFIIGSSFGTIPAIRASRLNPVDAIRRIK